MPYHNDVFALVYELMQDFVNKLSVFGHGSWRLAFTAAN